MVSYSAFKSTRQICPQRNKESYKLCTGKLDYYSGVDFPASQKHCNKIQNQKNIDIIPSAMRTNIHPNFIYERKNLKMILNMLLSALRREGDK